MPISYISIQHVKYLYIFYHFIFTPDVSYVTTQSAPTRFSTLAGPHKRWASGAAAPLPKGLRMMGPSQGCVGPIGLWGGNHQK